MIDNSHSQTFSASQFHKLSDERREVCDALQTKVGFSRTLLEWVMRWIAMSCNIVPKDFTDTPICNYIHDDRLRKFDCARSFLFSSARQNICWSRFRVSRCLAILNRYRSLCRDLKPRHGLDRLLLLDFASIECLVAHDGVRHFHVVAHFQAYVLILSELRRRGVIERLNGRQHGAFECLPLEKTRFPMYFDSYRILHSRFETSFRKFYCDNAIVELVIDPAIALAAWPKRGQRHVAFAFQGNDYPPDRILFHIVHRVCNALGVLLIAYPHPKATEQTRQDIAAHATIETQVRYADSICMVTGFSTLGFEFAIRGGRVLFVEVLGRVIAFDDEGLDVHHTVVDGLEDTLKEMIRSASNIANAGVLK